MFLFWGSKRFK